MVEFWDGTTASSDLAIACCRVAQGPLGSQAACQMCDFVTGWWPTEVEAGDDWIEHARSEHDAEGCMIEPADTEGDYWARCEFWAEGRLIYMRWVCGCGRLSAPLEAVCIDGAHRCPSCAVVLSR